MHPNCCSLWDLPSVLRVEEWLGLWQECGSWRVGGAGGVSMPVLGLDLHSSYSFSPLYLCFLCWVPLSCNLVLAEIPQVL